MGKHDVIGACGSPLIFAASLAVRQSQHAESIICQCLLIRSASTSCISLKWRHEFCSNDVTDVAQSMNSNSCFMLNVRFIMNQSESALFCSYDQSMRDMWSNYVCAETITLVQPRLRRQTLHRRCRVSELLLWAGQASPHSVHGCWWWVVKPLLGNRPRLAVHLRLIPAPSRNVNNYHTWPLDWRRYEAPRQQVSHAFLYSLVEPGMFLDALKFYEIAVSSEPCTCIVKPAAYIDEG